MSVTRKRLLAAFGAVALSLWCAVPAAADPDTDPAPDPGMPSCGLAFFLCGLAPAMPQLDHDLDLTQGQPPPPPDQETRIADPCFGGCV